MTSVLLRVVRIKTYISERANDEEEEQTIQNQYSISSNGISIHRACSSIRWS